MSYYLLEATLNDCICDFFFIIFFLQLIYSLRLIAREFYYIENDLSVKLNDKETVSRSCF